MGACSIEGLELDRTKAVRKMNREYGYEQDDRHRHEGERHWRGHRDWDRGGVYVGPSYGYYGYGYPPPPVYYPPQPGFSINIPLDIR